MAQIVETFPPPILDPNRWTGAVSGAGVYAVGAPSDGLWPSGLVADGDGVFISSSSKIVVPSSRDFDVQMMYDDLDAPIVGLAQVVSLGWRSDAVDGAGDPLHGMDVMITTRPGPLHKFERRFYSYGAENWSPIMTDPNGGANAGLMLKRAGSIFTMYRYETSTSSWVLIETITAPSLVSGFLYILNFATDAAAPFFPWIY